MQNRQIHYIIISQIFIAVLALGALFSAQGWAAGLPGLKQNSDYRLSFYNTHTRENLEIVYRRGGLYRPAAMEEVNHFLRDHRNGHMHEIDGGLLDLLSDLKTVLEARHPGLNVTYHVISGYRSKKTNDNLRAAGGGQAKRSQHIEGKAIDIRVPGIDSVEVRNTAWCLKRGGVGFYRGSNFVHVDTGKVRHWNWSPSGLDCKKILN